MTFKEHKEQNFGFDIFLNLCYSCIVSWISHWISDDTKKHTVYCMHLCAVLFGLILTQRVIYCQISFISIDASGLTCLTLVSLAFPFINHHNVPFYLKKTPMYLFCSNLLICLSCLKSTSHSINTECHAKQSKAPTESTRGGQCTSDETHFRSKWNDRIFDWVHLLEDI